jgi:phosphoribosylaminoimidazole-succinocarboxamide synthase
MYTGKTRESFINPKFPDLLYIYATDRISIFDIVLNARVPLKGSILTAMTIFWLTEVFKDVPNHLVAYGRNIKKYLPKELTSGRVYDDLEENMVIVKKTKVLKVEAIVRGYLTGSGLVDYKNTGKVCGIELETGLVDGSALPHATFTPSTKADYGLHDENISIEDAGKIIGEDSAKFIRKQSLHLYDEAWTKARKVGIIIADTKFEFGIDRDGNIILIDEVLTPDSSRYWPKKERQLAMEQGKTPPSLDKQPVRNAGKAAGVKENPTWIPSEELIAETSDNYLRIMHLITGKTLWQFHIENMGIQ